MAGHWQILGLNAIGWQHMTKHWGDIVLAVLALISLLLGAAYLLLLLWRRIRFVLWRRRVRPPKVSADVARCLEDLRKDLKELRPPSNGTPKEPKSFGVYLGDIADPPTPNQERLLSQWEVLVLDPRREGVLRAASRCGSSVQVLGRLDVEELLETQQDSLKAEEVRAVSALIQAVATYLKHPEDAFSPFTGVLLANWQRSCGSVILNEVVRSLNGLNLAVYLEMSGPGFITPVETLAIDMGPIRGLICRNGTIHTNGERCDYFQMEGFRRAQRALAKHVSMGGHTLLMWETVDDDANLAHSVIKRSYDWCRFQSIVSWIGPRTALYDADVAAQRTLRGEPLGALMWLKSNEGMELHNTWRQNEEIIKQPHTSPSAYESLAPYLPNLATRLSPTQTAPAESLVQHCESNSSTLTVPSVACEVCPNPFTHTRQAYGHAGIGCFPLGMECCESDFQELVEGQRRLKDLNLLRRIETEELHSIAESLSALTKPHNPWTSDPVLAKAVKDLGDLMANSSGADNDALRVFVGLHSGFRHGSGSRFWGLYADDPGDMSVDIFISGDSTDKTGVLLHTWLSRRQMSRAQCFSAEVALARAANATVEPWDLPRRLVKDIELLSPAEIMIFLLRMDASDSADFPLLAPAIQACCNYQLITIPTVSQLRALNTSTYLADRVSAEELVRSRLAWHTQQGCQCPSLSAALSVFQDVNKWLPVALISQQSDALAQLTLVLQQALHKGKIDAGTDIFALSVFCAFRRVAIEEVYVEVLDRNPLPNRHSDQAACFAEMFATGSQCETYFDMTSNALGRILADRYHAYYRRMQPPYRSDNSTELPTAYASKLVDEDTEAGPMKPSVAYQITFLGIFAVPALIDILLLTTIGRGLYLSTYMSQTEKTMATTGLMVGLLTCGGFGTWIGSGGSYYFFAMAFPAMNMFVLTRLVATAAFVLGVGTIVMLIIGGIKGFYAGFIFLFYFMTLSSYLTLLATMAIYQVPGFAFQSGRTTVVACIPILFLSPILTIWIGHDIVVYPCVLSGFLVSLVFGVRRVISKWGSWYLKVPCVTDTEVVDWYTKTMDEPGSPNVSLPAGVTDLAATPLPRKKLMAAITAEHERHFWEKSTGDEVVRKLAHGLDATMFLMDWYCKYSRTKMPFPFSPTWNLQCKAAIDTLKDMQKGLKLHNAFVHWRHGGDEVWCGVLYFVIALMDKWVTLLTGGSIVGLLSAADSSEFRLAVGFSLAYYLISAVCLDNVAQPLWPMANKKTDQPITSLSFLREAAVNDARARRRLYWTNWLKFFFTHIWGLCATAAIMWTFEGTRNATIMYLAYVGAYTGLLWYQYNRIYTGALAMIDLIVAACLGLLIGPLLRRFAIHFQFASVLALAVSTWTAAILSMRTAKIGWPKPIPNPASETQTEYAAATFSCSSWGPAPSQRDLSNLYAASCKVPDDDRYRLDPATHPGLEVIQALEDHHDSEKQDSEKHDSEKHDSEKHDSEKHDSEKLHPVDAAFPSKAHILPAIAKLWRQGHIEVDLVSSGHVSQLEQPVVSISRSMHGTVHVVVLVGPSLNSARVLEVRKNCRIVAEAVVQAATEFIFGFSHADSILAETWISFRPGDSTFSIPDIIKRQLECTHVDRKLITAAGERILLSYFLLGIECDKDWDNLPQDIRSQLLRRCRGEPCDLTEDQGKSVRSTRSPDIQGVDGYIARCNLGAAMASFILSYKRNLDTELPDSGWCQTVATVGDYFPVASSELPKRSWSKRLKDQLVRAIRAARMAIKLAVVALVADPEFQRELAYVLCGQSILVRWPAKILNGLWLYCHLLQQAILPWFIFYHRDNLSVLYNNMRGIKIVLKKDRVVIESLNGPSTCFFDARSDGTSRLHQYSGRHDSQPSGLQDLVAVNEYSEDLVLLRRQEWAKESLVRSYRYDYSQDKRVSKLPTARHCDHGDTNGQIVYYDQRGYISSGSFIKDGNLVKFRFWYRKHAKFDDELLRAEFTLAHARMRVSWCVPPEKHAEKLDCWIPHPKVTEATFVEGSSVWQCTWDYDHRSHPVITTMLNGRRAATPEMIKFDWFKILQKPKNCSFLADDLLLPFTSLRTNLLTRTLGWNVAWYPVSTSLARTYLWKMWKNGKEYDAVTARWLDDKALRWDRVMKPYWRRRDAGRLDAARAYLDHNADAIMARVDVDPDISSWTSIAYKISDFYSFGQGGDTGINTRSQSSQLREDPDILHVLAMDTGTWPNEGGGVSACRRDMVNDLHTIRWHVLSESANDFSTPKFQIERNVQSLSILPLWGLDFLTPTHGVFQNYLDSAVQHRSYSTTAADIKKNFLPILTSLVKCSRAIRFDREHIEEATRALVDLNAYFETSRHWSQVWTSDIVKEKWRELWLCEDMENAVPISQWLDAECPTLLHLDNALDMWHRYLFIFSLPVPEKIPDVFQASHHFTGASYGVLCKVLRGCSLHVWDHCISWREVTVFLSSAMSWDAPFVCTSLMSLSRMTSVLILHYADVVLPCADFFNPPWEVELGTQEGLLEHRKVFARKIDPVVNGICNMESFKPTKEIKSKKPTVTMLSQVRFVKDIKNAILAADIIVNEWGFKDYQLDIYGDMEKAPAYSVECKEILASKGLRDHVGLRGLGKPSKVLEESWLFLNSSISEGLPLAMGEAALTGVPVVCTDVGASFRVVTDPVTWKKFSAVVAPNDSHSLAKAQIAVLGMLEEWAEYAEDAADEPVPKLPLHPTPEDVKRITKRIYAKAEQRRRLGMIGRANVQKSFSSERYLREHEQMLWIAKFQSASFRARTAKANPKVAAVKTSRDYAMDVPLLRPSVSNLGFHSQSSSLSLGPRASSFSLGPRVTEL